MSWDLVAEAVVHLLAFVLMAGFTVRLVLTRPHAQPESEPAPTPSHSPLVVDVVRRTLSDQHKDAHVLLFLYAYTVAPTRTDSPMVAVVLDMLRGVLLDLNEARLDSFPSLGPCFRQIADSGQLSMDDMDVLLERIASRRPHDAWVLKRCAAMLRPELEPGEACDPLVDQAWLCLTVEAVVSDLSELLVLALIQTDPRQKFRQIRRVCAQRSGSVCARLRSHADAWTDRMAPRQFPAQLVDVRRLAS